MGAAALAGLVAVTASSGSDDETTSKAAAVDEETAEPVDVSIPYNAAAMLAYQCTISPTVDPAVFKRFEELYLEQAVAIATFKKMKRDQEAAVKAMETKISKLDGDMAALKA